MTTDELTSLIEELRTFGTDLTHIEAKAAAGGFPRRLWKSISALANTPGGGVLILGVDESSGFAVSGTGDAPKYQQDLASLCDQMVPPVRALIQLHQLEGAQVVTAEIPETPLDQKPCFYSGAGLTNGAFVRVADGDRRLTEYEIQLIRASRGQPREDLEPVPDADIADFDADLVGEFVEEARNERPVFAEGPREEILSALGALVTHEGRLVPSLGGLLALGEFPQRFFPECSLTFVAYPTERIGEAGPRGERFVDEARIDGPIPLMIAPVLKVIQRNMKRRSVVHGIGRGTQWEYPITALREAVVNALVHRDLSALARGTPVQVQLFPDRLTVSNPGGLHGPVTVETLGEAGVSSSRNATLMKILEDTPIPGEGHMVCENRGSGIGAMLASLRDAGMSPPEFHDRISTFTVTFPNHTLFDRDTLAWLGAIGADELSDGQRVGLALLKNGQSLSNEVYRKFNNMDSRVATRELRELVQRGLVEQISAGRWTTYRLPEDVFVQGDLPIDRDESTEEADETTLSRKASAILGIVASRGPISRSDIADALQLPDSTVRYWLKRLRESGKVEMTTEKPRDPNVEYLLANRTGRG